MNNVYVVQVNDCFNDHTHEKGSFSLGKFLLLSDILVQIFAKDVFADNVDGGLGGDGLVLLNELVGFEDLHDLAFVSA